MKNSIKNIKTAFTLMEIGLCLLIVSILVMLTLPLISNQVKKTNEYAYYMAFKTVEKMGSQIVAYGDPAENRNPNNVSAYNNQKSVFTPKNSIASYTGKILKNFYPEAYANSTSIDSNLNIAEFHPTEVLSFSSYEYDYLRVCLGNPNVKKDYMGNAGNVSWTADEVRAQNNLCSMVYYNGNTPRWNGIINARFMPRNVGSYTVYEDLLKNGTYSAEDYCKFLAGTDYDYTYIDNISSSNTGDINNLNTLHGECIISLKYPVETSVPGTYTRNDSFDTHQQQILCSNYGLNGMTEGDTTGGKVECTCSGTKAINNTAICCPTPISGKVPYAYFDSSTDTMKCIENGCEYNAFNEVTNKCCPSHSYFSRALMKCVCYEGYTANNTNNLTSCKASENECEAGTHLDKDEKICVSNSPITKAKRLCELIRDNWNVSSSNCDAFTKKGSIYYNKKLYNSITANNTKFLSVKAVKGAFNNVNPNLVFANGLRMWILGDKSASIAGLSYNPYNYTSPEINVCSFVDNDSIKDEESCNNQAGEGETSYFCKNDNKCFKFKTASELPIRDARNCCSSVDVSDLIPKFAEGEYLLDARTYSINGFTVFIDINGTKDNDKKSGGGTLWKDVFPFYVSSNGQVYPGYPLDAAKADNGSKESSALYQGGNSTALSTDVYYYGKDKNNKRRKINAYSSIPYARALCLSRNISLATPYCKNLGSKFRNSDKLNSNDNPCYRHRCFVKLKNKIKYL